jgi:CheY-like chemotaxis protein
MGTTAGTVLLVEDDDDVRSAVSELLRIQGYTVAEAANGREALDVLRSDGFRPCIILLDIMMPVMNGIEFRAEQLRDPALADMPVVVISADSQVKAKAASVRAVEYMQKPLQFDVLLGILDQHC